MLKRKIEEKLNIWLKGKNGLLVEGARQVGKTFILSKFAKEHFDNFIYVNLLLDVNIKNVLEESKDAKDFIYRITTYIDKPLVKNKTCIFIDEIQAFKDFDFITFSKSLIEEGSYRYIFSGSLLGVELYNIKSWPVGYVNIYQMFPLDFEEFLWANAVNENVIDIYKESFITKKELPDYVYNKLMDLFMRYLTVGGMPEAVETYINTNDYNRVKEVFNAIDENNKRDISKYLENSKRLKIKEIYDLIPSEINAQNKRFIVKDIENKSKNEDVSTSFLWLQNAGLSIPVYNVDEPKYPLAISKNRNLLKLFMYDTGILMMKIFNDDVIGKIFDRDCKINLGGIYENFVATMLYTNNHYKQYYYNNKKNGEIDFLIEKNGKVIPIEVKSGIDFISHSALNNIMKVNNYNIDEAYVFCNSNLKVENKIIYLPIYMVGLL